MLSQLDSHHAHNLILITLVCCTVLQIDIIIPFGEQAVPRRNRRHRNLHTQVVLALSCQTVGGGFACLCARTWKGFVQERWQQLTQRSSESKLRMLATQRVISTASGIDSVKLTAFYFCTPAPTSQWITPVAVGALTGRPDAQSDLLHMLYVAMHET
jgi:hypothetical protein